MTDDDFILECYPRGLEAIRSAIKASSEHRLHIDEIKRSFESNYLSHERPDIEDEDLRELLSRAGIQPVPGSENEYQAEKRAGADWNDRSAKNQWLEMMLSDSAADTKKHTSSAPSYGSQYAPARTSFVPPRSPAERAAKLGGDQGTRLATGFPTLDAATRGGILPGKVGVLGGAPGAAKTGTAVRTAYAWLSQGVTVGFLAADEDPDAILIRFGQLHGLSRDALENGDPNARAALAAWCKSVPLLLVDGDEAGGTIEAVSRAIRTKAGARPSVLFVDSMQTARSETPLLKGADARARINATVAALKRVAKEGRHVVVATSELSKRAYRNKDSAENMNALSAFKESGDIEYGVGLALVLTSRPGTSELVDAAVVKNRLGPGKPTFVLRLHHVRADVREAGPQESRMSDPAYGAKMAIKSVVQKACGAPLSKGQIAERVGGKRQTVWRAIDDLLEAHELHHEKHGIRFPLPGDPGYGVAT